MLDWEHDWEELLPRLGEGDGRIWQRVIDKLGPQLVAFAQKYVGEVAEDVVQNVLLDILERVEAGTVVEKKSFFFTRVRWAALQHLRDNRRKALPLSSGSGDDDDAMTWANDIPSREPNPLSVVLTDELLDSIEHGELLRLRFLKNMTFTEIAERLGWPVGTVFNRVGRALAQLREKLEDDGPTELIFFK